MKNGKEKSLKLNMLLNVFNGILGVAFPLISFPYVSKILGVSNLGKYNFAISIVNYFMLIAALGVNTYSIREGSKLKEDKQSFNVFAKEVFTINLCSTLIAYLTLFIILFKVPKLSTYRIFIIILSIQIVFKTVSVEWIYSIFEDYLFITIRSILFHCISLSLLFLFVKDSSDLSIYCLTTALASAGSGILNFFHAKTYCSLGLSDHVNWSKHGKPIITLFAMQVATTVYISSDTTILGFMCNDYVVGIYSVSTKIYSVIKTILASILVVSIPRLSSLVGKEEREGFVSVAKNTYSILLTFLIPVIIGIVMLRDEIIAVISGNDYLQATESLFFLCIALFFCLGAWFWGQCILIPLQKEQFVFKTTLISALANIILNFILIPFWKEKAAAITTVIAEAIAFALQMYEGRKQVDIEGIWKVVLKIIFGCLFMGMTIVILKNWIKNPIFHIITSTFISGIIYFIIEIVIKNDAVCDIKYLLIKRGVR